MHFLVAPYQVLIMQRTTATPVLCKLCVICSWDNVEELSAAVAHKKVAYQEDKVASDPLEAFCDDHPDADECRCEQAVHRLWWQLFHKQATYHSTVCHECDRVP